jgi:hypothetical protein
MRFPVIVVSALLLVTAAVGLAQTAGKTNYSGKWRMVKEKSEFGKFAAPDSMVRTVDHQDVTINVHTAETGPMGKASADVTYYTGANRPTKFTAARQKVTASGTAMYW